MRKSSLILRVVIIIFTFFILLGSTITAQAILVASETDLNTAGEPYEINLDDSGQLWVTEVLEGEVWKYDPTGDSYQVFSVENNPIDARQSGGWLWWADAMTNTVGMVSTSDGTYTKWQIPYTNGFNGTSLDEQGRFYATDPFFPLLYRLDPTQAQLCTFTLSAPGLIYYIVRDGYFLWMGDYSNAKLFRLNTINDNLTWWQLPAGKAPYGMAVDADGNLWYTDKKLAELGMLDPLADELSIYSLPAGTAPAMIAHRLGSIWYTERSLPSVSRLDPLNATHVDFSTAVHTQTMTPSCQGISPSSTGTLTISNPGRTPAGKNYSDRVDSGGWKIYDMPNTAAPWGIALSTSGYIVDTDRQILSRFSLGATDLSITGTDGKTGALAGDASTYTILISNPTASSVSGVTVIDNFPASLTGITWTCTHGVGSTCTASGSGNINDTITLAAGGSVTYIANATISASATGSVQNTARIVLPAGFTDPNLVNNIAADYTALRTSTSGALCGNDANLVACYEMDEGDGSIYLDGVQHAAYNDGTISGRKGYWAEDGKILGALRMDGFSNYGVATDESSLDIANQLTLAAWIKPEHSDDTDQELIMKGYLDSTDGYELSLSSTGSTWPEKVYFRINQASQGDACRINSTVVIPHDGATWVHVAATFDGTKLRLYINGVFDTELTAPTGCTAIGTNNLPLTLGAQYNGTSVDQFYQGSIDDVRVYNRVLSASEITELSELPTPVFLSGLSATSIPHAINLSWQSAQETDLIGFNILRAEKLDGPKLKINPLLIPVLNPGQLMGNNYQYLDKATEAGKSYYYWVEWVGIGSSSLYGPVTGLQWSYSWLPSVWR